jgi:hypothetical protein
MTEWKEIQKNKKQDDQKSENLKVIKDHLGRINKKLDEGNNRSLENHIALQSPNEIKCFAQIKETILKTYLLLEQDEKNERVKAIQSKPLSSIENKITECIKAGNDLDAILYTNLYQALIHCDTSAVIKLHEKIKNQDVQNDDFELEVEDDE